MIKRFQGSNTYLSLEKEQKVAGTGLGFCLRGHLVTRRSRVRLVPNNTVTNLRLKDH